MTCISAAAELDGEATVEGEATVDGEPVAPDDEHAATNNVKAPSAPIARLPVRFVSERMMLLLRR
jgi:hypothetical protein